MLLLDKKCDYFINLLYLLAWIYTAVETIVASFTSMQGVVFVENNAIEYWINVNACNIQLFHATL